MPDRMMREKTDMGPRRYQHAPQYSSQQQHQQDKSGRQPVIDGELQEKVLITERIDL